jgi:hypothetical protein
MDRAFGYGLEWDNGTKASMVPETPEPKEAS